MNGLRNFILPKPERRSTIRQKSRPRRSMSRHPLIELLVREIGALPPPRKVLVAVSGGADSMALLRGLCELQSGFPLALHVAHLDHQLRGRASCDDADFVAGACRALGLPFSIGRSDVAAKARDAGQTIEEAARDERYRFLETAALESGCTVIALAHTADDQAETVLYHILRGTGLAGLSGIPRQRDLDSGIRIVRPLLDLEKSVLIEYLRGIGQEYREDASNGDEAFTRNRIRSQLLPHLAREFNPNVKGALRRLGQQAGDVKTAFDALAAELLDRVFDSSSTEQCRLKWQPLSAYPRHLVREALAVLWRRQRW